MPKGRCWGQGGGRVTGVAEAKVFKGRYGAKFEFLEEGWGWGEANQKNVCGGMDIFWDHKISHLL